MVTFKDIAGLTFYHGTTEQLWKTPPELSATGISLTVISDDALAYSSEAGELDYSLFHENTDQDDSHIRQVILKIEGSQMLEWLKTGTLTIEADDGWATSEECVAKNEGRAIVEPTWKNSLAACGSIFLAGFTEEMKDQVEVVDIEDFECQLSANMS